MKYKFSYTPVGQTKVIGRVTYINKDGKEVTTEFNGTIKIETGNVVSQPKLSFKGVPTGSAVKVEVNP